MHQNQTTAVDSAPVGAVEDADVVEAVVADVAAGAMKRKSGCRSLNLDDW